MTHPVSEKFRVMVRRVIHGLEAVSGEVGQDGSAAHVEQGTDDPATAHRNPRKAARAAPLQDAHENCLDLIVRGVAEGDALGPQPPRDTR